MTTHEIEPGTLLDQSPDAQVFADRAGLVRYWNAAAERIFGFTSEEVLGQSLDLLVPEQFRDAHWTGFHQSMETGETKYAGQSLPTRAQHASGTEFYVELSFAIIRNEAGEVAGALASARDISERFERDRASRRRLRELEQEVEELRGSKSE